MTLGLLTGSCISDPWPEPDSMENDEKNEAPTAGDFDDQNNDTDGVSGEDETSDTAGGMVDGGAQWGADSDENNGTSTDETNTDADSEEVRDQDTDSLNTDYAGDAGDRDDAGAPHFDKVFISTPNHDGVTTVVGLAGTVSQDSSVHVKTSDAVFDVTVGREGGFADRFIAEAGELVTITVDDDNGNTYSAPFVTGDLNEQFANGIVGDGGQNRLTDTLISIDGIGNHLDGGYFVIGGNVSTGTSGMADVLCESDICRFSLTMSAAYADELDIFLIRNVGELESYASRAGTVVETLIAE